MKDTINKFITYEISEILIQKKKSLKWALKNPELFSENENRKLYQGQ